MADRNRHGERGDILLAELRASIDENRRVIEENTRVIAENSRVIADLRFFTRDLVARQDRSMREFMRGITDELRDLREEARAQREALLRVIDRLPPAGESAA